MHLSVRPDEGEYDCLALLALKRVDGADQQVGIIWLEERREVCDLGLVGGENANVFWLNAE